MTLHNYRSRQVHETLNGVNPSSSFRDMHSAKSGPNLWQIWQVFGPWASPYGTNGHMTMTVHTYRPRQFHRTSNRENPSSGYRDMGSASLAAARPAAHPPGPWRQYPSSPEGWGVIKWFDHTPPTFTTSIIFVHQSNDRRVHLKLHGTNTSFFLHDLGGNFRHLRRLGIFGLCRLDFFGILIVEFFLNAKQAYDITVMISVKEKWPSSTGVMVLFI